ncbi:uncharacterized protein EAF01_001550 [Botrytis porri]|uniref:uncharacterized protein n=1 Tax=Botrytis porri TaxID=87229 RepID=UPI001900A308|nr:uncharacterized protein EAF01_001550 [Botrytis porri]KAF7912529.1 hypothetical protein EAF01_001550 [Botrytis porri]
MASGSVAEIASTRLGVSSFVLKVASSAPSKDFAMRVVQVKIKLMDRVENKEEDTVDSLIDIPEDIAEALRAITNGASIRRASLDYGVPRTTLHDRIYGGVSHQNGAQILQKLSPIQENRLAEWDIKCISANGKSITPLVIYKGKSVQQQWFPTDLTLFKGWNFTATENGWTTDATALEWLKKIYIPQTTPIQPENSRLLILDGHGSHETTAFIDIMIQEKEIDLPTRRLLFRKIIKGFDAKDYELLEAENKIRKLEYQLDEALPRKRRKVVVSPNSKFAGIRAIRRTQIEAGDREDEVDDSSSAIESDSTGDFIEVQ